KMIEQLIKNPQQKFGIKDSAIADALRGLNKSELNALRLILKGGIHPDFSKFNGKQQSQLILIFKTLLEQGQPKRSEMPNSAGSNALKRLIEQAKAREPENRTATLRGIDTRTVASCGIDGRTVKSRDIDTRTVPSRGDNFGTIASDGIDTKTAQINEDQSQTKPIDTKLSVLPPISEMLAAGVKILQSECFTSDAYGIRISLRLQQNNRWETVCHYDIYSSASKRTQYLKARNPEQADLALPAEESKTIALSDLRKNWKSLCHQYLTQD
ncbi:MAG: hypothetical protein K2X81_17425, partial [Candidatus Obscuribacterales bacterium]|nr:hypothetical protein [Candidatus Obscuribacterales bacterium]